MKPPRISPKQRQCLETAGSNGGLLYSWPGGWWSTEQYIPALDYQRTKPPEGSFHELHVVNLIRHRLFEVVERQGRDSKPCTVRVVAQA